MRTVTILLRRDNLAASEQISNLVLREGEPFFEISKEQLFVGNGKSSLKELTPITSIAKSPDGKLYSITVDNNGNAKATLIKMYLQNEEAILSV